MGSKVYGECRCCLTKGKHRDIHKEYYHDGIREVFINCFMECFNLFLSTNNKLTTLICSSCAKSLRDACQFRRLVVNTERKLLESIGESNEKHTIFVNVPAEECTLDTNGSDIKTEDVEIKIEESDKEELDQDKEEFDEDKEEFDNIYESNQDDTDDIDSLGTSSTKSDEFFVEGEKEFLSRFANDPVKPLPTRHTLNDICPSYVKHLDLLKGIMVVPNMIKKLLRENGHKKTKISGNVYITEKVGQIVNITTLLLCSNMTPFKSRGRNGFLCFYCPNIFENSSKLRAHTLEHDKEDINRILKTYVTESLIVNVDVSNLRCAICYESMPNVTELKSHLTKDHKRKMYPEFTDRVIPFKLSTSNTYVCQVCGCSFETFGAIERHMNIHFRNYICKECGTGFVTKARLKVHHTNTHIGGSFPCEVCGKTFATQLKHKNHVDSVHRLVKRFKCNKCPERFTEYVYRQRHLVEVHGVPKIDYKCNVCEKSFSRRYNLSTHMKRDHMDERDFQCEMCSYKCFSSKQLSMHMVKHNGERIFECSVCKKSYARKKTLNEHMKIHNNDRRFSCALCGQAFVQKCSLKGHMKTHH